MSYVLCSEFTVPAGSLTEKVLDFIRGRCRHAWLVGGYVRDCLMGRGSHDLDLIVPEGGVQLAQAVASAFGGAFFILDHERDVARAILRQKTGDVLEVDVACLRAPGLAEDLALRDFTINAIAVDITKEDMGQGVSDPFDGRGDLARGLVRAVSEEAFRDDPLRALRAVRMAVELGFRIEEATASLIRRDAGLLSAVAGERIRDELFRVFRAPGAWQHLRLLAHLNLLPPILPEAAAQIGVVQSPPHYQDVFDHTRAVLAHLEGIFALLWRKCGAWGPETGYRRSESVPDDPTIMAAEAEWDALQETLAPHADALAAHLSEPLASGHTRRDCLWWAGLAHDWGKPAMRTIDGEGLTHFFEHEHWGALLAERRCQVLKLASDEAAYVALLVEQHMRVGFLAHAYPPSRRAVYRFFRDLGLAGPDCVLLSLADHLAIRAGSGVSEHWDRRLATARLLLEAYFWERESQVSPPLLMNGSQIMAEFGLRPGPLIGQLLAELREAQAAREVGTAEDARAWIAQRVAGTRG